LKLRGVVKHLALFCRYLALLALCHLFSRQATRKNGILSTDSVCVQLDTSATSLSGPESGLHLFLESEEGEEESEDEETGEGVQSQLD